MERLSAMLQRKEQELLLQREREASGNSGASTLELKLLIQEKYSKLKELERRELASVSESPQQTRSNVLGLLARRVNQAANPVPVAAPGTPPATPETGSDANAAKEGLDRRPSLDDFIETGHFNSSLASTDLSLPATQSETPAYSAEAVSHFRIKSGLDEPSVALRFTPDRHVAPLVTDSTDAALDPGSDGSALPSLSVGVTPAPPILPRTSSKKIGSMLQQLDSMTPAFPGSTSDPASNPVLESPPKLNVPLPTQTRFTTLRKEDWGAFKNLKKQQLSQQLMQQANNGAKPESAMRVTSNESNTSEMSDSDTELDVSPKRSVTGLSPLSPKPERKLILEGPAWTVATISSLKECYLFLFNDMLVITKPYERRSSKRIFFMTVTVLSLASSRLTFNDPTAPHPNNGLLLIDQETRHKIETVVSRTFESHPVKSVSYLISKGVFPRTPSAVATFLLTTPRLNKVSLGKFLALPSHALILQSYMRFFNFTSMDLLPAFRMILCALRLPTDEGDKVDTILDAFVDRWLACNPKSLAGILPPSAPFTTLTQTPPPAAPQPDRHWQHDAVRQVVFALLALDFEVHYAQASVKEESVFLARFLGSLLPALQASLRARPDAGTVSVSTCERAHRLALVNVFESVVEERLEMGELSGDRGVGAAGTAGGVYWMFSVEGCVSPFASTTPFLNLTVGCAGPLVTLRVSQPVPGLVIEASGVDVLCEPRVLDFRSSAVAVFRVTPLAVGRKVVLFTRRGGDARGLENPAGVGVLVEPEWLRYRFAVEDAAGEVAVVAVAGEGIFGDWERALRERVVEGEGRETMGLNGNNPYGTMWEEVEGIGEAVQSLENGEERVGEVKRKLMAGEEPIARSALLDICGADAGERK